MPSFPESGVKLVADAGDFNAVMDEAIAKAQEFDSIGDLSMSITVDADTSEAESALDDLPLSDETVNFTVEAEVTGDEIPQDGEEVSETVDIETTDEAKKSLSAMEVLAGLEIMKTVWTITGNAIDLFNQFSSFAISPMLRLDEAVARVNATTGNAIPNAKELIAGIFYDDLGESIGQVGEMITKAEALKLPVEEAARSALTFTHTWTESNPSEVITTFGTLLKTNLVDNLQEAADLMTVFFQEGGNKGGDALQVVNANAESWSNMGLNAQQALSTISSLLQGNVDNASDAAKMIQTLDDNLTIAAANASSPQAQLLKQMGLENPKDKGESMGADFIDGFATAFSKMSIDKQDLISGTFMGKGGKKFTGAIESMTASSDLFANAKDQAKIAAEEIDDSLTGAIDRFMLAAEQKVTEFLSSAAIDLPGKIELLKKGLQDAVNSLSEGGSLSDALTIALKPLGFDDEFQGLESALGNFVIGILQAVSQLQDITGHGAEAEGTRFTIHQMAAQQLAFDLKIGNPDEIAAAIKIATERGLDPAQIAGSISTAVDELVKSGSPEAAQAIIDSAKNAVGSITFDVQGELTRKTLESQGQNPTFTVPVTPEMTPEDIQKTIDDTKAQFQSAGFFLDAAVTPSIDQKTMNDLQSKVDNAFKELNPSMEEAQKKITDTTKPLTDMATSTDDVKNKVVDVKPKLDALAQGVDKMGGVSRRTTNAVEDTSVSIDDAGLSAMLATVQMNGFGNAIDEVAGKLNSALNTADKVAQAGDSGSGGAAVDPDASGPNFAGNSSVTGTFSVGERGREIVTTNQDLAVLNNMSTEAIMQALSGYVPGGYASSVGTVNNTINNNNIIPNEATADALGYRQAETLRGMR